MKNKITKLFLALLTFYSGSNLVFAQNVPTPKAVLNATNTEFLTQFAQEKELEFTRGYEMALKSAAEKNMPVSGEKDGYSFALVGYNKEDGTLKYFRTSNNTPTNSSLQTANAKPLQAAGILGAGMRTGVFDGGVGQPGHLAFAGGRYVVKNNNTGQNTTQGKNHAAHVAGTIAGGDFGGTNSPTRGFATEAQIYAYNWFSDLSKMAAAAADANNKIYVSNHSYGLDADNYFQSGGNPSIYGQYNSDARNYDIVANNAPYYTIVFAAGNDRGGWSQYNPSRNGKDLLSQGGVSKNIVTVAATRGTDDYSGITGTASVSGTNAFIASFSNFGPTDDFRIKPDISAKGVNVLSITATSISSTDIMSGTSMAAPAVTGVFTLWQQYFNQIFRQYMRSSTVRALMAHTAKEAGPAVGPDHMFGWGLIDADKGKQVMDAVGLDLARIAEINLLQATSKEYAFTYTGTEPLVVTMAWNDPAAAASTATNQNLSKLVNDLDLRVINTDTGAEFFPWSLKHDILTKPITSTDIATRLVDNTRDNIEKVEVNVNTPGNYKVVVNHKGNLTGGSQVFSLIISGAGTAMPPLDESVSNEEIEAFDKISLYPNPATAILNISGDLKILENSLVEISDVTGKKVYNSRNVFSDNNASINIENLSKGIYLLTISKNGVKKSYKFIKD